MELNRAEMAMHTIHIDYFEVTAYINLKLTVDK